jgi:hypothetical protein
METCAKDESNLCTGRAARRLWNAVLLQAIEDWRSSNARRHTEAEVFFFRCQTDFACVCSGAGIDARSLQDRLAKIKPISLAAHHPARQGS